MPCPHYQIKILSRGKGQSAVAAAAYQSGERLYDERSHRTKHYSSKEGIVYNAILLPDNAPSEYLDRNNLWNAVEAVEPNWNSQLARRLIISLPAELSLRDNVRLVREYSQKEFVAKGMIADFSIHDPDPPGHNPHVHVMLTMRPMDEQGHWMEKSHKAYKLDEDGNRIRGADGKWETYKVSTTDWNNKGNAELWRNEWEKLQNRYLEQAGRSERVSMKSYDRQGINQIPMIHMGPQITAMERNGIRTRIGSMNQEIRIINRELFSLQRMIGKIDSWLSGVEDAITEIELQPKEVNLADLLIRKFSEREDFRDENWERTAGKQRAGIRDLQRFARIINYMSANKIRTVDDLIIRMKEIKEDADPIRSEIRKIEDRMKVIDTLHDRVVRHRELAPIHDQYLKVHWNGRQKKFAEEHKAELDEWKKCDRYLRKFLPDMRYDPKTLHEEQDSLLQKLEQMKQQLKPFQADLDMLKDIRFLVKDYLPELVPEGDGITTERKTEKRESLKARLAEAEKEADMHNAMIQRDLPTLPEERLEL